MTNTMPTDREYINAWLGEVEDSQSAYSIVIGTYLIISIYICSHFDHYWSKLRLKDIFPPYIIFKLCASNSAQSVALLLYSTWVAL